LLHLSLLANLPLQTASFQQSSTGEIVVSRANIVNTVHIQLY
jgi:hypothetical protein